MSEETKEVPQLVDASYTNIMDIVFIQDCHEYFW